MIVKTGILLPVLFVLTLVVNIIFFHSKYLSASLPFLLITVSDFDLEYKNSGIGFPVMDQSEEHPSPYTSMVCVYVESLLQPEWLPETWKIRLEAESENLKINIFLCYKLLVHALILLLTCMEHNNQFILFY